MIVKIGSGKGFQGAADYILHDKKKENDLRHPETAERVGFAYSLNCGNPEDIQKAVNGMINTANNAQALKAEAGGSTAGKKLQKPLKTVVLSWEADETPTQQEQKDTVEQFLKKMGWEDHQAIVSSHTDTNNPHVHILINRVNPETGKTLNERYEYRRSNRWSLQHMHENGRIRADELERRNWGIDKSQIKAAKETTYSKSKKEGIEQGHDKRSEQQRMARLEAINPAMARRIKERDSGLIKTPEQKAKLALGERQKGDWHSLKQGQEREKSLLEDSQLELKAAKGKAWNAEMKAIPEIVLSDLQKEFGARFAAVSFLPKDQRHGARQNLHAEMAARRKQEQQDRRTKIQIEKIELKKQMKGQMDELYKEHSQANKHMAKSHRANFQSLDSYYRQEDLVKYHAELSQRKDHSLTRARNSALLQATKSGTGINSNSYYNRLIRRQELEDRAANDNHNLQPMHPEAHRAAIEKQKQTDEGLRRLDRAKLRQVFKKSQQELGKEEEGHVQERNRQREELEESKERSAALVKDAQEGSRETTDRGQETKDHQLESKDGGQEEKTDRKQKDEIDERPEHSKEAEHSRPAEHGKPASHQRSKGQKF